MTFSDPKVAALVNANFVAAWINRGGGFHNEDYAKERWIFRGAMEAYPTKNICTFFMTPGGDVFHYVAGYFAPATFRAEVEAAIEMRGAAFDGEMRLRPRGLQALAKIHRDEAERIERTTLKRLAAEIGPCSYRDFKHTHTADCVRVCREGDRYRSLLHAALSGVKELPAFEATRFDYLYGDPFTEEPGDCNTPVAGRWITRRDE